jgi:hypothetical protein
LHIPQNADPRSSYTHPYSGKYQHNPNGYRCTFHFHTNLSTYLHCHDGTHLHTDRHLDANIPTHGNPYSDAYRHACWRSTRTLWGGSMYRS